MTRLRALLIQKDVKLYTHVNYPPMLFESFVNSERCKTLRIFPTFAHSLRVLLIQKDVKLTTVVQKIEKSLRALLIQKDVKLN